MYQTKPKCVCIYCYFRELITYVGEFEAERPDCGGKMDVCDALDCGAAKERYTDCCGEREGAVFVCQRGPNQTRNRIERKELYLFAKGDPIKHGIGLRNY